jgi:magnesium transporter
MIKAIYYDSQQCREVTLTSLEAISDLVSNGHHLFWLDLLNPTAEELAMVGGAFNLHPLALEDATTEHQRPKIEQYDTFYFIVFYAASFEKTKKAIITRQLNLFVGHNYLITVRSKDMPELEEAEWRWRRNNHQLEWGIGLLLYVLLDSLVDNCFPVVDRLVECAEEIEDQVYTSREHTTDTVFRLLAIKQMLLQMRRLVTSERDVLNVLTNRDNPIFHERVQVYFRDVYDHVTRLADTLDLYRDQLSSMMDANISISSHSLNQVMRTLTATSIILMSGSLIAGIYGMNFNPEASPYNMPELNWAYGYVGALGSMVLVSLGLLLFFKHYKWF